jgi:hypothetical protein
MQRFSVVLSVLAACAVPADSKDPFEGVSDKVGLERLTLKPPDGWMVRLISVEIESGSVSMTHSIAESPGERAPIVVCAEAADSITRPCDQLRAGSAHGTVRELNGGHRNPHADRIMMWCADEACADADLAAFAMAWDA